MSCGCGNYGKGLITISSTPRPAKPHFPEVIGPLPTPFGQLLLQLFRRLLTTVFLFGNREPPMDCGYGLRLVRGQGPEAAGLFGRSLGAAVRGSNHTRARQVTMIIMTTKTLTVMAVAPPRLATRLK